MDNVCAHETPCLFRYKIVEINSEMVELCVTIAVVCVLVTRVSVLDKVMSKRSVRVVVQVVRCGVESGRPPCRPGGVGRLQAPLTPNL